MTALENPYISGLSESRSYSYVYWKPFDPPVGPLMEFRLVYKGPLHSDGGPREKHAIRQQLHPQLKELWNQQQFLREHIEFFAKRWQRCGFRFIPLITKRTVETCALDIIFLRRDHPGNLIRSGGDIDNRLKVLFDGLRMPEELGELGGAVPGPEEDPFFCLLQDDELITEVNVTTDRLLTPKEDTEHHHNVVLVIRVRANVDGVDNNDYVIANNEIVEY